jgi:hypothetical protein
MNWNLLIRPASISCETSAFRWDFGSRTSPSPARSAPHSPNVPYDMMEWWAWLNRAKSMAEMKQTSLVGIVPQTWPFKPLKSPNQVNKKFIEVWCYLRYWGIRIPKPRKTAYASSNFLHSFILSHFLTFVTFVHFAFGYLADRLLVCSDWSTSNFRNGTFSVHTFYVAPLKKTNSEHDYTVRRQNGHQLFNTVTNLASLRLKNFLILV